MTHFQFNIDDVYAAIDIHLSIHLRKLRHNSDDLRQVIIIAVIERAPEYNPALASWETFIDRIITSHIERFLLDRRWQKNQSPESLEEITENKPEKLPLLNDVHSWELGIQESAVYAGEIRDVIHSMPKRLREVAEALMHYSQAEVADMMGIAPNVLQHDIKKLKKIFEKANMVPNDFEEI